jgi:AcrR family transcriptional regulator
MEYQPATPRERILASTIDLIEEKGIAGAMTRSIAAAAGVNIAAINYYYKSKEALIEAALTSAWDHGLGHLRSSLAGEPWDARKGLLELAAFFLEEGSRFPVVSRATLFDAAGEPRLALGSSIAAFVGELEAKLEAQGAESGQRLHERTGAFLSALLFPILAPHCLPWLGEEAAKKGYVAGLVDDFLAMIGLGGR